MKKIILSIVAAGIVTGWTFWPREALSHGAVTTTVHFDREIVRILNNRCVMCHMDGGISFPLSTYEETWLRGRSIRTEILRHQMPPWPGVAGYGQFANDNSLTLRESQFLVSWVEGLGPRNGGNVFLNVSDPRAPARQEVRASAHVGHWQLGEPHLVRQLAANRVEPRRADFVQRTVVDLGLTAARRVTGLEYSPGDRRVVRAAVFTVQETGQWLGSWTPWYGFVKLPDGVAYTLAPGSHVVAEIHYRSAMEPVLDRGTLGLFFANRQSLRQPSDLVMEAKRDGTSRKLRAVTRIAADTSVWAMRPDVAPGLESIQVSARRPDGGTDVLLFARKLSTDWPTPFILKQPHLLRRGTVLSLVASRDGNSTSPERIRLTLSRYAPPARE